MVVFHFVAPNYRSIYVLPGTYFVQLWGAQGGQGSHDGKYPFEGGRGSYVSALLVATKPVTLYLFVGSKGGDSTMIPNITATPGWNGGGRGGPDTRDDDGGGGGGGATDLRLGGLELSDRILVAAGGSGSSTNAYGAPGGNTKSYSIYEAKNPNAYKPIDATGPLGKGEDGIGDVNMGSSGAGGGYYGGTAVKGGAISSTIGTSNSGTSFIAGYLNQDTMSKKLESAGLKIFAREMKAGFEQSPNYLGGLQIGNPGNGCLSITLVPTKIDKKYKILPKILMIALSLC